MRTHHRAVRLAAVPALLALLLAIAACQGGTPSGKASTPAATSPASATPTGTGGATIAITVTSSAFADGAAIPTRYSCRGGNQSPPLEWKAVPSGAKALALILDDPDAVGGRYVHWVVTDIPTDVRSGAEGQPPKGGRVSANSGGDARYLGPCPPAGTGVHHYRFTVYALSRTLGLPSSTPARDALSAIGSASVGQGTLVGTYQG